MGVRAEAAPAFQVPVPDDFVLISDEMVKDRGAGERVD